VKTLSSKEQKIQDLEKTLSKRSEASGQEVAEIMGKLKILFDEYRKALREFGVRPGSLPESGDISELMD
jgi:ElaB/YqjD/DUF883 family membrane-anchored ribosome-binding protein